jgi:hypothetical protein
VKREQDTVLSKEKRIRRVSLNDELIRFFYEPKEIKNTFCLMLSTKKTDKKPFFCLKFDE